MQDNHNVETEVRTLSKTERKERRREVFGDDE